jgi:Na+/H+-dicarboxylate symporter
MSLGVRVLIGLLAGLLLGVVAAVANLSWLSAAAAAVSPLGTLWVNAIRMTVVPLVVSLLITSIAGGSRALDAGRIGGAVLLLFVLLAGVSGLLAVLAAPALVARITPDPASMAALGVSAADPTAAGQTLPGFRDWLVNLVPANPVRAAVDGAMLPLVIFSVLLGAALTRAGNSADTVITFFRAVKEAMLVLVGWVLAVAPIGVFALVLPLVAAAGPALAGAIGYGVAVMCALVLLASALLYVVAAVVGGVPLSRFARAVAPAQAVAFGSRSSLAALPAMITAGREGLGLPATATDLVLPVAVSVFKYAVPVARVSGTLIVARLFGIDLGSAQIVMIAAAVTALSFYAPGIPSATLLMMAPVYMSFGIPVAGIGLLIAVDVVVDTFVTAGNVTGDLTVAVVAARWFRARVPSTLSSGLSPSPPRTG